MARRAGSADLPLHSGHVPQWLADRMTRLGAVVSEAVVHHFGRDELLRRLAHPFWFQSFGAVMGMDWHSSGITTSVTPQELEAAGERVGFDGAALQDGFELYLHGFIVADDGRWVVVQQGMNGAVKQARRYHWLSEGLQS